MDMVDKFFRFTSWRYVEHECHGWFYWFSRRGLACAVISRLTTNGGSQGYAVYREGEEAGEKHKRCFLPLRHKVIRSDNGWVERFRSAPTGKEEDAET